MLLRRAVISNSHNALTGGPPLVGCPRLLLNIFVAISHIWKPFLRPQRKVELCYGDRDPLEMCLSCREVKNTQSNIICIIYHPVVHEYFHMSSVLLFYILEKCHIKKIVYFPKIY
jgi:hypothetical protein